MKPKKDVYLEALAILLFMSYLQLFGSGRRLMMREVPMQELSETSESFTNCL